MPVAVLQNLICPVCGGGFAESGQALRCEEGHSFDVARQGYVNLLSGRKPAGSADTATMVAARAGFLDAGFYRPIADALADAVAGPPAGAGSAGGLIVDVGAGTGHYLADVLERLPAAYGVATDVSVPALRRAARAHPRMAAVGADVWRGLPIRSGSAAVVLDVFAPRNAAEFHRVVRPDGLLGVVTPLPGHLGELVDRFGMLTIDERKDERVDETLATCFRRRSRHELTFAMDLGPTDIGNLIRMGPSAHHLDEDTLVRQLAELPERTGVTASVRVSAYQPVVEP
ncbi:methyltransferase domain-containing protein [Phytoactinopolyspora sp. XMNu-373]|uniref:Methyltransferase domain-containing protein n=1 Tax=Phytoactinopolyspora mesophila TaxID=2650750 RepID=A0A7K3LYD2_9ACTN|nr:methyltransferase domain-containing protein [Phytoactinopolyspora mesophila]NDL56051.1 methyltransferase domain-containing protein [Phytoactinopolyspora mesophila]